MSTELTFIIICACFLVLDGLCLVQAIQIDKLEKRVKQMEYDDIPF